MYNETIPLQFKSNLHVKIYIVYKLISKNISVNIKI